jgi:hypothetical protein
MQVNKIKIEYAPNTIYIVGPKERSVMIIQNSKGESLAKQNDAKGLIDHCNKCCERMLAILN